MGVKNYHRIKSRILILFFGSLIILSALYLGISIYNKPLNNYPFTQIPRMAEELPEDKISSSFTDYYKEFTVTERTGSNQNNVIIDQKQWGVALSRTIGFSKFRC